MNRLQRHDYKHQIFKLSQCFLNWCGSAVKCIKIRFKAIHHLQNSANLRFLLPSSILRLYNGCRLDQTLSQCIASFQKVRVLKC